MTRKQRRLTIIGGSLAVLAVAAALVLNAMRDSIVFFSTPAMVAEKHIPAGRRVRVGGPGAQGGGCWRRRRAPLTRCVQGRALPCQARRDLHAKGGSGRAEEAGALER